jgi:hypothetical protein
MTTLKIAGFDSVNLYKEEEDFKNGKHGHA